MLFGCRSNGIPGGSQPSAHTHEPSLCAAPWPEHVVASEYWHELPTQSDAHAHVPSPSAPLEHAPWPEHGVVEPPAHSMEQSDDQKPSAHEQGADNEGTAVRRLALLSAAAALIDANSASESVSRARLASNSVSER